MSRLPIPGSDDGVWGNVLNDYLSQSHNADGTQKDASVSASALKTPTAGSNGQVLAKDSAQAGGLTWVNVGSGGGGTVSDATTTSKGVVQLAGDLGGTAASPTVPALATMYTKAQVDSKLTDSNISRIIPHNPTQAEIDAMNVGDLYTTS